MTEPSPEGRLWDLMRGALCARALAIVVDQGVVEALAGGPRHVEELGQELAAEPDTLRRLLRALASDGVFAEEEPGVFRHTEASELLRDGWGAFGHLFGGAWLRAAGALDSSGRPSFADVFGTDFWSWLAGNPEERALFDRAMEEGNDRRVNRLAELDWGDGETVVDVGGGNGSLLVGLLGRHRELRGIVFDLPETTRDESRLGDRCAFIAGDFFERVPRGDVYVLSTILHDWDDESAARILGTIRGSAPAGARVRILDAVVPDGNGEHGAKWLDLLMLALFGGRERNEAEWRALLGAAGLEPEGIADGLIEARCP
jgi:hypothetical protein